MPVPNTFANATATIPLSQLDANFATTITLGNTAIQLGNTVTTLNNMTLANVNISSGIVTITNATVTTANVTTANIATAQIANVTVSGTGTFAAGSNTAPSITTSGDTNTGIFFPAADTIAFTEGGVESMRIDASGRVGIGTDSPATTLHLKAAVCNVRLEDADTSAYANVGVDNSGSMYLQADPANSQASSTMYFSIDGTERMRIDSSGNLGLGVTPSAWRNVFNAFQFGESGSVQSTNNNTIRTRLSNNTYVNSSGNEIYLKNGAAHIYIQDSGGHQFFTAASGTAGNAITFTQAMTLDADGNLLVGTTSTPSVDYRAYFLKDVATNAVSVVVRNTNSTGATRLALGNNLGIARFTIGYSGSASSGYVGGASAAWLGTEGSEPLAFQTNGTERARITGGGDFCVGKTAFDTNVGFAVNSTGAVISSRSGTTNGTSSYDLYSTGASAYRFYVGMAGTVFATNTTISAISDVRHKENIRDLDVGLAEVMQLQPRVFDWKEGKGKGTQNDRGFIAQEFEQVFPDLIDEWKDPAPEGEEPYKAVRADLIPVLVKAIQELNAKVEAQAAEIAALKAQP
jgi:hypothetical protein